MAQLLMVPRYFGRTLRRNETRILKQRVPESKQAAYAITVRTSSGSSMGRSRKPR